MEPLKYIRNFSNYITEQAGLELDEDGNPIQAAAPKDPIYSFLFIEKGDTGDYKYPDGSSSRDYHTYEITKSELEKWIESNVTSTTAADSALDIKRAAIFDYIAGEKNQVSPNDKEYLDKFKNNVNAETVAKQKSDIEVTFAAKTHEPSTDSFDVTFIINK